MRGVGSKELEAGGLRGSLLRILSAMRNVDFILGTRGKVTSPDLYFKEISIPDLNWGVGERMVRTQQWESTWELPSHPPGRRKAGPGGVGTRPGRGMGRSHRVHPRWTPANRDHPGSPVLLWPFPPKGAATHAWNSRTFVPRA